MREPFRLAVIQILKLQTSMQTSMSPLRLNKNHYCLAYKQYGFRTGILVQWLAELVMLLVQCEAVLIALPVRKSVLLTLVLLSSNWIKQFIKNFIYRCLGGANINVNRIFQFYDSWKIKFDLSGPVKWNLVDMKIQLVSFVV